MSDESKEGWTSDELVLGDGEVIILNPQEFRTRFGAIAIKNIEGAVYILHSESLKWKNVTDLVKIGPRAVE